MTTTNGGGALVTSSHRRGAWEVLREVRKVVQWFDLVVGCLVVAGHGALLGTAMVARVMACSAGSGLTELRQP
jgi:hypothetical protein